MENTEIIDVAKVNAALAADSAGNLSERLTHVESAVNLLARAIIKFGIGCELEEGEEPLSLLAASLAWEFDGHVGQDELTDIYRRLSRVEDVAGVDFFILDD